MLTDKDIRKALRASRVVPLGVPNPHGPLRLQHLAAAAAQAADMDRDELSIPLRRQTREKLEQLARAQGQSPDHPFTAAELAAAVVEQFVASIQDR